LAAYAVLVVRTAWVGDDAFISLRTVDNLLHGYGLRWNVSERVQSYTHPLWLFLLVLANALVRDPFYATLALALLTSLAAMAWLGLCVARTPVQGALAVTLLALSRGFVDFSTSGLENPLSHLLVAVFLGIYLAERGAAGKGEEHRFVRLAMLGGLITLNREDTLLVILPCLIEAGAASYGRRGARATLRDAALGAAPLVAWLLFSLVYYGFLLPNTAFAKLSTGIAAADLRAQGGVYLLFSVAWDPAGIACVLVGLALGISSPDRRHRFVVFGALLSLGYVVAVGGDFMAGRFLTVPMLALACVIASRPHVFETPAAALAVVLPFALLFVLPSATEDWPNLHDFGRTGIADERKYYRRSSSLMLATRESKLPSHAWRRRGERLARKQQPLETITQAGYLGYFAGPSVHLIDRHALSDPLLARLPAAHTDKFRVGHYLRALPRGYEQTLATGECAMTRPLCRYYRDLALVTRGDLFSWQRFGAIVRLNLGLDDGLLREETSAPERRRRAPRGQRRSSLSEERQVRD
jgi:arabinofuranosyltransferase